MARYLAAALVVLAGGGTKVLEPGRFNHYYDAMGGESGACSRTLRQRLAKKAGK